MKNTCSIKLLKKAYIGVGVRMSSGKGTVPFNNIPMKGMVIENYSSDGFQINHENFPESVWLKFHQLPLTRLIIKNGVIEDEITFVENIVSHQMQLIRTLDTEYIDLLYAEKHLESIADEMIPIGDAIVGDWYKGAQCKAGIEMVFLGTFYQKTIHKVEIKNTRDYKNNKPQLYTYHFDKNAPKREFFAVQEGDKWDIISYPSTNKKIKKLITLHREELMFANKTKNHDAIFVVNNDLIAHTYWRNKTEIKLDSIRIAINDDYPRSELAKVFKKKTFSAVNYLTINKRNIDVIAFHFVNDNFLCPMDKRYITIMNHRVKASIDEIDFGDGVKTGREILKEKVEKGLIKLQKDYTNKENSSYYIIDGLTSICGLGYQVSTYSLRRDLDDGRKTYSEIIDHLISLVK